MKTFEEMLGILDAYQAEPDMSRDIINFVPDLSYDDAYRLQIAHKQIAVEKGDQIIGYQASYASAGGRKTNPTMPSPMAGTLLRSNLMQEEEVFELPSDCGTYIEPEVGILLKRDLMGPGVTMLELRAATEAYMATIEIVPWPASHKRSNQMTIALHNRGISRCVLGSQMIAPHIDLRTEGVVVRINGEVKATGVGADVLNDPLNVALAIVNIMGRYGTGVKAGQILMTGTLCPAPMAYKGDTDARFEFTRLGTIHSRFS